MSADYVRCGGGGARVLDMGSGPSSATSLLGCYVSPFLSLGLSFPICKMAGEWVGPLGLEGPSHLRHPEHLWAQVPPGQCLSGFRSQTLLP